MTNTAHSAFEAAHFERADRRQAHIERLENGITELAAHIYAATYRLLELIREYDECEGWAKPGLRGAPGGIAFAGLQSGLRPSYNGHYAQPPPKKGGHSFSESPIEQQQLLVDWPMRECR